MKRIIEGVTYNTDTATLVAETTFEDEGVTTECELYQNRAGVYFGIDTVTTPYKDKRGEWQERVSYDWTAVGDAAAAREYVEKYSMTITRDIDDMPPEAVLGEKLSTVYVRVTPTLKSDLDEASSKDKISGNQWATRCLERCLAYRDGSGLEELAEIGIIASYFMHGDEEQDRELCLEALQQIANLVQPLARKLVGTAGAFETIVGLGDSVELEQARRKYSPLN